jgi:hypothetical protein
MQSPNDQGEVVRRAQAQRMRLLYSLNDLQQALSACEFLYECDESKTYSKVELRRFRCFETTLVIAYTRPFSQSRGIVPNLTFKMAGLKLSKERISLHERLMDMRNQIMAHSDSEMMRMTTQTFSVPLREGEPYHMIQMVFDEGVTLLGRLLIEMNELLNEVYHAVYRTLNEDLQANPELFNLRIDSKKAARARMLDDDSKT